MSVGKEEDSIAVADDHQHKDNRTTRTEDYLAAADLLRGRTTVRIRHGDDIYVLRVTRSGKLILTK